jgi:hypothetical protein
VAASRPLRNAADRFKERQDEIRALLGIGPLRPWQVSERRDLKRR